MRTESTYEIHYYCVTLSGVSSEMRKEGSFWSGFASGAAASLISGAVGGVCGLKNVPAVWTKTAMIAAGGIAGGVSSKIAGGEFIDGFCNGLICAGLNHALHYAAKNVTGPDDPPGKKNNNAKQLQERANNASAVVGTEATMVQKAAVLTELMEGESKGLSAIYKYAGKVGRWCLGINVGVNYTLAIKGEISFLSATMRSLVGIADYASFGIPYVGPLVGGSLLYYDITGQFENTLYNDIWMQEHVITPAQQYMAPNYSDYGNTPIYYRHGK